MDAGIFLRRNLWIIVATAIIYIILARLSQFLFTPGTLVTPVWPPAGLALAVVLIFGDIALIGVFIGNYFSNFHMFSGEGITLWTILYACVPAIGGAVQAYVAKVALKALTHSYNIFKNTFNILVFIFICAFAACLINAVLGNSMLILSGNLALTNAPYSVFTWWIADAVGVVVATPVIMSWYQTWREKISGWELLKLIITWILILIVGYITLKIELQLFFLLLPFAIWAAFQFSLRLAVLTGLLITSICLYGSAYGEAVIQSESVTGSILLSQVFVSIVFLIILLTNVIVSERQKAYKNLRILNVELENRVLDRTKDLSDANQQLEIQKDNALKAYESLKQAHARLMQSEKMASLGLLTAGVAHEIKHPLNAMSSNIDTMQKNMAQMLQSITQASLSENEKNEINKIKKNNDSLIVATHEGIKRTAGIIADLSAFARADEPEMVLTDLNRNIDSTLNLLSSEIKRIKIEKEYGAIPQIYCHPGKINQVMMNILINAVHALQTTPDAKIMIKTEVKMNDNFIFLTIKDNGPGIKKEVLDKLFTPFFTTKAEGMGSGLGLFLSQNIIKEHRGKLVVTSELGKGTEFIIRLPCSIASEKDAR
jgi:two-component system NtrC family sensor kinase